jgi:hypothetical protein
MQVLAVSFFFHLSPPDMLVQVIPEAKKVTVDRNPAVIQLQVDRFAVSGMGCRGPKYMTVGHRVHPVTGLAFGANVEARMKMTGTIVAKSRGKLRCEFHRPGVIVARRFTGGQNYRTGYVKKHYSVHFLILCQLHGSVNLFAIYLIHLSPLNLLYA